MSPGQGGGDLIAALREVMDGINHQRLLQPIGYIAPAEAEANHYRQLTEQTMSTETGLNFPFYLQWRIVQPNRWLGPTALRQPFFHARNDQ